MSLLDDIFLEARTCRSWQEREVDPKLLEKIHDLAKLGPTSGNGLPLRIIYIVSKEAKEKLEPCLDSGNVKKTMSAPLTAIFASDLEFYSHFEKLNPKAAAMFQELYGANSTLGKEAAELNGLLQAAYYMIAARASGLDLGPMSGFDAAKTERAFFNGRSWKALFLCNMGYGIKEDVRERLPRFEFNEITEII